MKKTLLQQAPYCGELFIFLLIHGTINAVTFFFSLAFRIPRRELFFSDFSKKRSNIQIQNCKRVTLLILKTCFAVLKSYFFIVHNTHTRAQRACMD